MYVTKGFNEQRIRHPLWLSQRDLKWCSLIETYSLLWQVMAIVIFLVTAALLGPACRADSAHSRSYGAEGEMTRHRPILPTHTSCRDYSTSTSQMQICFFRGADDAAALPSSTKEKQLSQSEFRMFSDTPTNWPCISYIFMCIMLIKWWHNNTHRVASWVWYSDAGREQQELEQPCCRWLSDTGWSKRTKRY